MPVKRISPEEARDLVDREGYTYLDVRSIPEFEAGHPTGAYNVPLNHMGPAGMSPNPDFMSVVQKSFPADAKLVLGCKGGGRSLRAAQMLEAAGYTAVVDQRAGFEGNATEPGWRPRGLPVATKAEAGREYESLRAKK
jgi:rhodanese-related sulfurtransferase